jgi:proline iminopeptidase
MYTGIEGTRSRRKIVKTAIIIGILVVLALIFIGGAFLWYTFQQPLYQPGMLRAGENLRAPLTPPVQSDDEQFWEVEDDIRLYHFSEGEGRNVLIVHGGPGYPYAEPWLGLAPLTSDYTFHYYDQRGSGNSTRPIDTFASSNFYQNATSLDRTLGIGAQLADIERIRHILGDEKLIIIGHSFGGFLASLYAAEFPEHVEALILIAPADVLVMPQKEGGGLYEAVGDRLSEDMQEEYAIFLDDYLDFKNLFSKSEDDLVALNQEFGKFYAAVTDTPSIPEQGKPGGWMTFAVFVSMGRRHDYRNALEDIRAPVLVIHGTDDLQTEDASRIYVDAFPDAEFQVIQNAGHFPFLEQPEVFAVVVSQFLDELD